MAASHIVSFVGNVGSGKSTTIHLAAELLREAGFSVLSLSIDEERQRLWESMGKPAWTWAFEDEAYGEMLIRALSLDTSDPHIVLLETTGLARRMRGAHRRLAQFCPLSIVKIECHAEACVKRHQTRAKRMSDYPDLPLEGSLEDGIIEVGEAVFDLEADFVLNSESHSVEQNVAQLLHWLVPRIRKTSKHKRDDTQLAPPVAYVQTLQNSLRKRFASIAATHDEQIQRIASHSPLLIDTARTVATQLQQFQKQSFPERAEPRAFVFGEYLICSLLQSETKSVDVQIIGMTADEISTVLEDCFPDHVRFEQRPVPVFHVPFHEGGEARFYPPQAHPEPGPEKGFEKGFESGDFTIESIFFDCVTSELIDTHNGLANLIQGKLQSLSPISEKQNSTQQTSTHFLSIYKACRLAGRYGFTLDAQTASDFRNAIEAGSLFRISAFYTSQELRSIFTASQHPSLSLEMMRVVGVLGSDFPEIEKLAQLKPTALSHIPQWTKLLQRVDIAATQLHANQDFNSSQRFATLLACVLFTLLELRAASSVNEDQILKLAQEVTAVLQPSDKIFAKCVTALLCQRQLKQILEDTQTTKSTTKASPTPPKARGLPRFTPIAARKEDPTNAYRQNVLTFFDNFWPLQVEEFLIFLESCAPTRDANKPSAERAFIISAIKKYKIDTSRPGPLLRRNDLVQKLQLPGGPTIGLLIGEIEKRRLQLITRERTLSYLTRHLQRLLSRVAQSTQTTAPQTYAENPESDGFPI